MTNAYSTHVLHRTCHNNIRDDIKNRVAKHSRYVSDLYQICAKNTLSRSDFYTLLDEMQADGEIRINQNDRVLLPERLSKSCLSQPLENINEVGNGTREILVHCLVNRSIALDNPKQKKNIDARYYAQHNYTAEQILLDSVCEDTLLKGHQVVPGEFTHSTDPNTGLRTAENWKSQQMFLIEFDDTTENTLAEFVEVRPFLQQNAWLVTESIRSQYDDPDDDTCNGQLRPRIAFCIPHAVNTRKEREWVYAALEKELPGCDTGSANSITNGGLGNASAEHIKIGKVVNTNWFHLAIDAGKKAEEEKQAQRERVDQERKRKKAERAAMGFSEREGELPLEALAKSEPSLFLAHIGLVPKGESGQYQHWGRPEKQGDTALSVWRSDHDNWQISVFANSIPLPPGVSGAMPFARFYCYHEFNTDIEGLQPDNPQWKDINARLATRGYGTWLSDEEFNAKHATPTQTPITSSDRRGLQPVTTLPPDHPILNSAPPIEVRERPSFPHFSPEERAVVDEVLGISPDAGWQRQTPIFTTRYEYLHPLTEKFKLNGQPSEVEKRRVWSTLFGNCEDCGAVTARWVDRYFLTAGFYCDGCHKDYHLGSYLELELNRKLPNSIESDYQGFLGDDPEFANIELWVPGTLTHLGAGMSTGKSTEIYKAMIILAKQGRGKGIITTPRISLARFLAYYLRQRDGDRSWGLWHEGSDKSNRFIGDLGAIVCLPSLPRAVKWASDAGIERLYIAIDELDFAYGLLSLSVKQATAVKKELRDALASTGLVVSGQTESTLALEAFAAEVECEQVQAFYNTAKPSDGQVTMHKYPDVEGKSNAIIAGAADAISEALSADHNVYTFCATRRDGDILAKKFSDKNPVVYNAYTKGYERADAILKNQKLTDGRLFIATSAAGVGISILDPNARTIIAGGLNYGSRDINMMVQMAVRDRGRRGVDIHYADYALRLPIKPVEIENVSLYHEAIKRSINDRSHLPKAGIKKIAYAEALTSLADVQIETFIEHHLGSVGNMSVSQESAQMPKLEDIELAYEYRRELRHSERENKLSTAITILKDINLRTSYEIRVASNKGDMSADDRIAHECANNYACAVGWNDEIDRDVEKPFEDLLDKDDIDVAIKLAENNINTDKLAKQRRGYLSVRFPKWTNHEFEVALAETETRLVNDGLGVEITSIQDDRLLGELLRTLLDCLPGKAFKLPELASAVREVLTQRRQDGKTFLGEINRGALGSSEYRKARFLSLADDEAVVDWISRFIAEWYPARIQKRGMCYGLVHIEKLGVCLKSFHRWLMHQPSVPDGAQIDLDMPFQTTELPDPDADLKKVARFRREGGETIKEIAESLNRNPRTIAKWCADIKPPSPAQCEVLDILRDGTVWKTSDIAKHSRFARRNVDTALKKLLDVGAICRIKRGQYQKR